MKKTYINPETIVVKVQPVLMQGSSMTLYGKDATSAGMSRRGDFWDDEEEDE